MLCLPALYAGLTSCNPRTTDNPLPPVGDSLPPVKDPCKLYYNGTPPDIDFPVFYQNPVQYYGGVFHPSKPDLCALVKQDLIAYSLYTVDVRNGKQNLLYHTSDNTSIQFPAWNTKGWLLFVCIGWDNSKLMKVKENGDSLSVILEAPVCRFPVWSADGSRVMYQDNQAFWEISGNGTDKKFLHLLAGSTYSIANNGLDDCAYVGGKLVLKKFGQEQTTATYENPLFSKYGIHGLGWYPNNRDLMLATNHGAYIASTPKRPSLRN